MDTKDANYEYCFNKLQENPLFENIDKKTMASLMECFSLKKWSKNTKVFHGGKTSYRFYIIVSGRVKMYQIDAKNDREFTVFLLSKNDVFDIISLLDGLKHSTNIETLDDVELLSTRIEVMQEWIETNPQINKALLPYLGKRMRLLETNLTDNVFSDIPTRLARLFLSNVDGTSSNFQLINDLSNDEIASLIGSTRAVVNRHIQIFKKAGMLETERKSTKISDLKLLMNSVLEKY